MVRKAIAGGLVFLLAGCSAQLQDRGGDEGAPPDYIGDVDYVEVYRNADAFPNISRVCVRGIAFATTSTGRGADGTGGGATPLIRVAEWDGFCEQKRK